MIFDSKWVIMIQIACLFSIRYAMEAHLVHFNSKYGNLQTAVTKADGVVVLAFFIQPFGDTPCKLFGKIADKVKCIREYKSKCEIDSGDCLLPHQVESKI